MVKVIRVIINQYDGQSDMSDHRTLQRVIKMMTRVMNMMVKVINVIVKVICLITGPFNEGEQLRLICEVHGGAHHRS